MNRHQYKPSRALALLLCKFPMKCHSISSGSCDEKNTCLDSLHGQFAARTRKQAQREFPSYENLQLQMLEPLKLLKILQNNHKCTKLYFLRRGGVSRPAISNSDTNDEQLWKSAKVGINKLLYPIQRSNRQFAVLPWLSPTAVDRPTPGLRQSYRCQHRA